MTFSFFTVPHQKITFLVSGTSTTHIISFAMRMNLSNAADFVTNTVLGIDTNERYAKQPDDLDTTAYTLLQPADIYLEQEPTVGEFLRELAPTRDGAAHYLTTLFPSFSWIRRYCLRWLLGDFIAGLTIGLVVVPQALAYALLAGLDPAYGLYTSFTGAVLYWIFGTSKDIVIGVCYKLVHLSFLGKG